MAGGDEDEARFPMTALHSNDHVDTHFRSGCSLAAIAGEASDRDAVSKTEDARCAEHAIGGSAAWRAVLKRAAQVAATETTACLQGESGSGKEVVARYIHTRSPRRHGPFIAINCAALP